MFSIVSVWLLGDPPCDHYPGWIGPHQPHLTSPGAPADIEPHCTGTPAQPFLYTYGDLAAQGSSSPGSLDRETHCTRIPDSAQTAC